MSNRLFQGIIHQMRDVVDRTIGVIDETGSVIACSDLGRIGEVRTNNLVSIFSSTFVPSCKRREFNDFISDKIGIFVSVTLSFVSKEAQIRGRAAFFAPLI